MALIFLQMKQVIVFFDLSVHTGNEYGFSNMLKPKTVPANVV